MNYPYFVFFCPTIYHRKSIAFIECVARALIVCSLYSGCRREWWPTYGILPSSSPSPPLTLSPRSSTKPLELDNLRCQKKVEWLHDWSKVHRRTALEMLLKNPHLWLPCCTAASCNNDVMDGQWSRMFKNEIFGVMIDSWWWWYW